MKIILFYKTVWQSLGSYKKKGAFLFIAMILAAAGEGLNIGVLMPLFSYVMDAKAIENSFLLIKLGEYIPKQYLFIVLLIFLFIIILTKNILKVFVGYLSPSLVWNIRNYWTNKIIGRYLSLPYHKMIEYKQGYLVNNAIEEPLRASKMLTSFLSFNSTLFFLISIYITLIINSWRMTLILSAITFVTIVILQKKLTGISVDSGHKRLFYQQQLHGNLTEAISGFKEVKIFQVENSILHKIKLILNDYRKTSVIFGLGKAIPAPFVETIFVLLIVVVSIIITVNKGNEVFIQYLPVGAVFVVGGLRLFSFFSLLSTQGMNIMNLGPSYKKVMNEIADLELSNEKAENTFTQLRLKSLIEIKNLSFSYKDKIIIENLSLKIKAKQTTFIVGESGKGKSTLAFLLLGLIKPNKGSIFYDGNSISDEDSDVILNSCSYVSQDNFLFHSSIKDNILFGAGEKIDADFFKNICRITEVDSFVEQLPDSYNTIVGDRGDKFSEGQKQRIALARALAKNAELFIFDEPTSNLDKNTSKILKGIINYLKENGKTIVVITHKDEDLVLADYVIKL